MILSLVFMFYCSASLEAATLSVGSGAGEPEDTVVVPISLSSSVGEEVCGLNLDLHYDISRLTFESIALGEKAQEAGKSLSSSQPDEGVVRALVIGFNQNWTLASLGPLRLGAATDGSVITLGFGYWLSLVDR